MRTQARGVVLHLFLQIALVETRQPRRGYAVALALHAVAGETGVVGAAWPAAEGDHLSGRGKRAIRLARRGVAGGQEQGGGDQGQEQAHTGANTGLRQRFHAENRRGVTPQDGTAADPTPLMVKLGEQMRRAHPVGECGT